MVRRGNIKIDDALCLKGGLAVDDVMSHLANHNHAHSMACPVGDAISDSSTATAVADAHATPAVADAEQDGSDPIALIHQSALSILSSVGVAIRDDQWKKEILAAGGTVLPTGRIALNEKIITNAIATAPKKINRVAQNSDSSFDHDRKKIFFAVSAAASHLYHPATNRGDGGNDANAGNGANAGNAGNGANSSHRLITSADHLALVKLVQTLPLFDMAGFFAKPDMLAKELGSIDAAYHTMLQQLIEHQDKPFALALHNHHVLPSLLEKFSDLPQRASLSLPVFLPNLALDSDLAASFMLAVKRGMTIDNHALTISAATAPATVAGGITLGLAMNLAALTLSQIVNPSIPFSFGFMAYASDLKQGTITTGSAETILLQQLAVRVAKFYNIPAIIATTQTSAKIPDAQSGIEKSLGMMSLVQTAMAANHGIMVGQAAGVLGDLQIIGQTNFIIDHDMVAMVKRAMRPPRITPDTIQKNVIERVLTKASHFFAEPETRQIMKSDYLYPMAQDRLSLTSWLAAGNFTADMLADMVAKKIMKEEA